MSAGLAAASCLTAACASGKVHLLIVACWDLEGQPVVWWEELGEFLDFEVSANVSTVKSVSQIGSS